MVFSCSFVFDPALGRHRIRAFRFCVFLSSVLALLAYIPLMFLLKKSTVTDRHSVDHAV
jgi:hypothetical protein